MRLIDIMERLDNIIGELEEHEQANGLDGYINLLKDVSADLLDVWRENKTILKRGKYDAH